MGIPFQKHPMRKRPSVSLAVLLFGLLFFMLAGTVQGLARPENQEQSQPPSSTERSSSPW